MRAGWDDERVKLLTELWAQGLSAAQVAKQLGFVTRNAVIGKVTRLGLPGRAPPSKPQRILPAPRPVKVVAPKPKPVLKVIGNAQAFVQADAPPPLVIIDRPAVFSPLPGSTPRPYLERASNRCRWPVGGEGADMLACCLPNDGGPYCVRHHQMSVQAKQPTAKELIRSTRRAAA